MIGLTRSIAWPRKPLNQELGKGGGQDQDHNEDRSTRRKALGMGACALLGRRALVTQGRDAGTEGSPTYEEIVRRVV